MTGILYYLNIYYDVLKIRCNFVGEEYKQAIAVTFGV